MVCMDPETQAANSSTCSARPNEKDKCHGGVPLLRERASWLIAFRLVVASLSDWPPLKNMMPGIAGGTHLPHGHRAEQW